MPRMTWEERQALVSGNRARRTGRPASEIRMVPAHLTVGAARDADKRRRHAPRQTWNQPGWSDVSPYWRSMVTVDRRWDK